MKSTQRFDTHWLGRVIREHPARQIEPGLLLFPYFPETQFVAEIGPAAMRSSITTDCPEPSLGPGHEDACRQEFAMECAINRLEYPMDETVIVEMGHPDDAS